jgi:aminoglycoside phosphotransferase (APT) family kinase protein
VEHGYTNQTDRRENAVYKVYKGPGAAERKHAELRALTALAGLFPAPAVIASDEVSLTTVYVKGRHGQDLIDAGLAREVLSECGRLLQQLHQISPTLMDTTPSDHGAVIQHGDFGPNNILFDADSMRAVAVVDWEFSRPGLAITDLAWCEWIVRMHHPAATGALPAFFDAYGARPAWPDRKAEMLRHCRSLEDLSRGSDPHGRDVTVWRRRAAVVAGWTE